MIASLRGPLAAGLILLPTTALAALPPVWQRVREFQAVVEAAARVLGPHPIEMVERIDGERYRVRAGACRVTVRLVFRPHAEPGPQAFDAVPESPDCP